MDEEFWLSCKDLRRMLPFVAGQYSPRKGDLYMAAGLRAIWHLLYSKFSRDVVKFLEAAADDPVRKAAAELLMSRAEVPTFGYEFRSGKFPRSVKQWLRKHQAYPEVDLRTAGKASNCPIVKRVVNAAHLAYHAHGFFHYFLDPPTQDGFGDHLLDHIASEPDWPGPWLIHEVLGNPFRPLPPLPPAVLAWNERLVSRLAAAIYEEKAFDRMPILADALEEAGCSEAAILRHCRQKSEHVRGCWVVDALTARS
jgi:hypothetical protein